MNVMAIPVVEFSMEGYKIRKVFVCGYNSQMMKTSFSLLGKVHRENPVFITGMGLQCGLLTPQDLEFTQQNSVSVSTKVIVLSKTIIIPFQI